MTALVSVACSVAVASGPAASSRTAADPIAGIDGAALSAGRTDSARNASQIAHAVATLAPVDSGGDCSHGHHVQARRLAGTVQLEIATQDVEGVRIARAHGADRVELCQALPVGGLTPSQGQVEQATTLGVRVRSLIRPRAGGYRYTAAETSAMVRDVETTLAAGAEAVVVGALTDEALDRTVLRALVRAAAGAAVIVHRCVDVLLGHRRVDPAVLVQQLLDLGVSGMLTSGGAARALAGRDTIAALAEAGDGRLEIVAGGGVLPEHVPALARAGVHAIHLSAAGTASAGPAGPGGGDDAFATTDPAAVTAARAAVDHACPRAQAVSEPRSHTTGSPAAAPSSE